ncbi:MAG: hypothetical protein ACTSRZ_09015 [Promethearchaeota archaeon]
MNKVTKKVTAVLALILAVSYGLSLAAAGVSIPGTGGDNCGG